MNIRLSPDERKKQIVDAAIKLAEKKGLYSFSIREIINTIEISHQLVYYYFANIEILRVAVIKESIKRENLKIISQAMVGKKRRGVKIPDYLRKKVCDELIG
jgi:AcrR family transcriptional regulator